jgi:peptidoglycan hydrolase CwlO-like protein
MGIRLLSEDEFNKFNNDIAEAEKDIVNRDKLLD